ncbi:MAG TPA: NAD(P)-dependent oxidoreductase [Candidatus Binatia bacterium]|nr:NAD(P)-dependent oxidoreductase [Candidatus Binatia bacterium]
MAASPPLKFVVENDSFLRLIQAVLDPNAPAERIAAFSHFCAHDLPDFPGWCEKVRSQARTLHPTDVRLVDDETELLANVSGAQAIVVESLAVGEREIAAAGGTLRVVQKYGITTPRIDRAACERAGVQIMTLRRRANISTAEQALTLMLALARQLNQNANLISEKQLRAAGYVPTRYERAHTPNGNWARITGLITLYQRQLGIIGLGEIGRELALRAAALEMRIVYTQRHRLPANIEKQYHATYCSLDELLATSDCVSLHLPRANETRNFISARELAIIKPGALLINVSQPHQVDRDALREALASRRLGGFGLDTFYDEPGDADDPLIKFRNVIVSPHLGGSPRFNSLDDIEELIVKLARVVV